MIYFFLQIEVYFRMNKLFASEFLLSAGGAYVDASATIPAAFSCINNFVGHALGKMVDDNTVSFGGLSSANCATPFTTYYITVTGVTNFDSLTIYPCPTGLDDCTEVSIMNTVLKFWSADETLLYTTNTPTTDDVPFQYVFILPTASPSVAPTISSSAPTVSPSVKPTVSPSVKPTVSPSVKPTVSPSVTRTVSPSVTRTVSPTVAPRSLVNCHSGTGCECFTESGCPLEFNWKVLDGLGIPEGSDPSPIEYCGNACFNTFGGYQISQYTPTNQDNYYWSFCSCSTAAPANCGLDTDRSFYSPYADGAGICFFTG